MIFGKFFAIRARTHDARAPRGHGDLALLIEAIEGVPCGGVQGRGLERAWWASCAILGLSAGPTLDRVIGKPTVPRIDQNPMGVKGFGEK